MDETSEQAVQKTYIPIRQRCKEGKTEADTRMLEKRNIWHIMTFFSIEDILNSIDMGNKKGTRSLYLLEILATK